MTRPKHSIKELDQVLEAAWDQGWRITRDKKYWKLWCPCDDKHMKTVHLTPSNGAYKKNLLKKLERSTCWKKEQS